MTPTPYFAALSKVRPHVEAWSLKFGTSPAEAVCKCPACGGNLTMRRSSSAPGFGAEIRASCSTAFCVNI